MPGGIGGGGMSPFNPNNQAGWNMRNAANPFAQGQGQPNANAPSMGSAPFMRMAGQQGEPTQMQSQLQQLSAAQERFKQLRLQQALSQFAGGFPGQGGPVQGGFPGGAGGASQFTGQGGGGFTPAADQAAGFTARPAAPIPPRPAGPPPGGDPGGPGVGATPADIGTLMNFMGQGANIQPGADQQATINQMNPMQLMDYQKQLALNKLKFGGGR